MMRPCAKWPCARRTLFWACTTASICSKKSIGMVPDDIGMIFLYRRPLLDYWIESREDLSHLVRHVLIHKIGHHFGFSDAGMATIEDSGI